MIKNKINLLSVAEDNYQSDRMVCEVYGSTYPEGKCSRRSQMLKIAIDKNGKFTIESRHSNTNHKAIVEIDNFDIEEFVDYLKQVVEFIEEHQIIDKLIGK